MKFLLTRKSSIFLLRAILSFSVFAIFVFVIFSLKQETDGTLASLSACEKNVFNQDRYLASCELKAEKLFQRYGECTEDTCLLVNETEVVGYFTYTADIVTEKSVYRDEEFENTYLDGEFERTYLVFKDVPATASFLLNERFPGEERFIINGEVPKSLKNRRSISLTTTFPEINVFGPFVSDHPSVYIISE